MTTDTNHRLPLDAWYARRWAILQRDQFACQYCGQFAPNVVLHVDHRVALCDGGTNEDDNLVTACSACNLGKEGYRASVAATRPDKPRGRTLADDITELLALGPRDVNGIALELGANLGSVGFVLRHNRDTRFRRLPGVAARGRPATWTLIED